MISQLITRGCTITRRLESETTDEFGNEVPDEDVVETLCELQQVGAEEPDDKGELSDARWRAFLLPTEAVNTGDTLTVDDESYEVVGDPWRARNPRTQEMSHVEVRLRRTSTPSEEVGS